MEGAAARVVRALKYAGWTELADAMAGDMAPGARELAGEEGALLVPVPLAPSRRRERGYNQAELLARSLSGVTGWPARPLLGRRSGGRAQAVLGRAGRRDNVSGAFRLVHGSGAADRVLLVDDVVTTGATVRACAAALETGGLRPVGAVAFARTLPPLHGA